MRTPLMFQNSFLVWVNEDKTIGGFYGKVWANLEQHLNFKSDVIVPASGLWGRKHINNTWDGVIGMVNRGEAEVGVCDIAMNAERVGVVSYTMQIATFHYKVFIRKGDEDVSWVSFLQAFSAGLWLAIVASVFVMALALKICFHVGLLQGKEHSRHNKFHDWLFATLGALICLQGKRKLFFTFV
ncbi:uncharacterized protein LOC110835940 isoform X1 [Zootermopsis nevadensis]|uniref:uncharacterized protein LOC110835940 isoform X1 n=1 Tax=Zootermopsis nevadensis TaxID=136037 RepID=UPI000B8EAFB0|nr:uncharacterized protein LOC110835940 isoform X1 [Zootermopsis nevadensis]